MRKHRGMTLVELMIVVAIIGILAAIAYPSYRQYVIRANRTSAKTTLLQMAQAYERCYARTNTYVGCVTLPYTTPDANYQVTASAGEPTITTFALQAAPQGTQANDAQCATFTLDQTGLQNLIGASGTLAECWGK